MILDRRMFLATGAAAASMPSPLLAALPVLRPEDFGARGDGTTNDTRAFAALGAAVNRQGGGTISLRAGRTYIVGGQVRGPGRFGWNPEPILELRNLGAPLAIIGNGARLRCQSGLRFGTFDPGSDRRVDHPMPNLSRADVASPYRAMISIENCRASIEVRDVELDGNLAQLRIGGRYGDKGWQVPGSGLVLVGNTGAELVEGVYSHHHPLDGMTITSDAGRPNRSRVIHLASRYNGRQGLSITGGRGYDFADCEFSHTGRSAVTSPPGAGVDIEAERPPIRDLSFTRCKFIDNVGAGLVADSGDSADARFSECLFVGTTNWSAWPRKPGLTFDRCTFVGSVVHAYPDADAARAARFTACTFTDDPKMSPTGKVYLGPGSIVNLGASDNVMFDGCTFRLVADGTLPWSWRAIYRNCRMTQRSPKKAMTKGKYLGSTTIDGPVDLYGSMIDGVLVVNGRTIKRGPVGRDFKPW
jgi:hypothetical protein